MGQPPSNQQRQTQTRNDPGESNDPRSSADGFEGHIWSSLHQIFERLGKLDQKIDQLGIEQGTLKSSVEKHDKLILRVTYTVGGIVLIVGLIWLLYVNVLKDHIVLK